MGLSGRLREKLAEFVGSVDLAIPIDLLIYWALGVVVISQLNVLPSRAGAAVLLWSIICVMKWYGLQF